MHIIIEILLFINLLDGPIFSVKLVNTTKRMVTKPLHFCIHWILNYFYISVLPFQKTQSRYNLVTIGDAIVCNWGPLSVKPVHSFVVILYWQFKVDIGHLSGTEYKNQKQGFNNMLNSQKLQLFEIEKFWNNFYCIVFLFKWAQKVWVRFLKFYFKLEILLFLSFVVSFLVDMFN